jgi:hypothetical protein
LMLGYEPTSVKSRLFLARGWASPGDK